MYVRSCMNIRGKVMVILKPVRVHVITCDSKFTVCTKKCDILLTCNRGENVLLSCVLIAPSFNKNIIHMCTFFVRADYENNISIPTLRLRLLKSKLSHFDFINKGAWIYVTSVVCSPNTRVQLQWLQVQLPILTQLGTLIQHIKVLEKWISTWHLLGLHKKFYSSYWKCLIPHKKFDVRHYGNQSCK